MRNAATRGRRAGSDRAFGVFGWPARLVGVVVGVVARHPRNAVALTVGIGAVGAVLVNALFLQPGPHPAPLMMTAPSPIAETTGALAAGTRGGASAARAHSELIANIQRELAWRGFYDGAVDGIHGAKTDAAIRDFEQAVGRKSSVDPSVALLQDIRSSTSRATAPSRPVRNDPIAQLIAPSRQVLAVQRTLNDFGYGPVKTSGIIDNETRAAVIRFERERRLPVTGDVSARVVRELAARTGRPLE